MGDRKLMDITPLSHFHLYEKERVCRYYGDSSDEKKNKTPMN
jgi:hypothetical protein